MLSKNEIKYIQSLCHKKQRQQEGVFIAEGPKLAEELLQSDYLIKKMYAVENWIRDHNKTGTECIPITDIELQKISALPSPNQVLVVVEQKGQQKQIDFNQRLTLVLDGIQDPGNLGTIIRIADWFGIQQIIASIDTVELYNPKVIQSTMGSFVRVQVGYESLSDMLRAATIPVFGALLNGKPMQEQPAVSEGILVIGNEAKGIRKELLPFITHPLTIPRIGGAESLNAAVATGIIVSHLKKS